MKQKRILGIELGSTRIKSVLIDGNGQVLAMGAYDWENKLVDGLWSYDLDDAMIGLQASYADLVKSYGAPIEKLDSIGISAMMHGYIAQDKSGKLLAPFRTWRNTNTAQAAGKLSDMFSFNVPMRWSVSQYYQSVLDGLDHVKNVAHLNTLSGYIHHLLTGERVLGVGDASGMFPIKDGDYNADMLSKLDAELANYGINVGFRTLLPRVLSAGESAGVLSDEGARLLDPTGKLMSGCPMCAPEGDMGTGMVCTNTVKPKTANASLGTSANLTVILDGDLKGYYPEIDVITTPDGYPAALIHTNTCTSVIDAWVGMIGEALCLFGAEVDKSQLYRNLFEYSQKADADVGGVASYNFLAGEPLAKVERGAPAVLVSEGGKLSLANFMQSQLFGAIATLALGLDLLKKEGVSVSDVFGHGGYFKTEGIGQSALSALIKAPVTVTSTASEGGAYGIALLALYLLDNGKSLPEFLDGIFADTQKSTVMASDELIAKCDAFMDNYKRGLIGVRAYCSQSN